MRVVVLPYCLDTRQNIPRVKRGGNQIRARLRPGGGGAPRGRAVEKRFLARLTGVCWRGRFVELGGFRKSGNVVAHGGLGLRRLANVWLGHRGYQPLKVGKASLDICEPCMGDFTLGTRLTGFPVFCVSLFGCPRELESRQSLFAGSERSEVSELGSGLRHGWED